MPQTGDPFSYVKLIDWFWKNERTTEVVCVFSGLVLGASLFLPKTAAWAIGIAFGLLFLAALSVIIVGTANRLWLRRYRLTQLSADEKEVLRAYMKNDCRTIPWTVADAKPKSLVHEGILFSSPDMSGIARGYNYYTIHNWVFIYLGRNRSLVETATPRL